MSQLIVDIPVTHISPVHSVSPVIRETTQSKDCNIRRNSVGGRSTISNSKERATPIYHRASTSSCHDLCKYGKTPESRTKGKQSIVRRSAKAALSLVEKPAAKHETSIEERKKRSVVKPKPTSPEVKTITEVPSPNSIRRECKCVTREVSSPSKKIDIKPRFLVGKVASPPKAVSSPNASSPSKKIVAPAKPAISLKQKVVKTRLSSSPLSSPQSLSSGRNASVVVANNTVRNKIVEKKSLSSPRCSLSPKPSAPRFATSNKSKAPPSSLKNQSKVRNVELNEPKTEKLREKTLYVIEPKPENKRLSLTIDVSPTSQSSEEASSSSTPVEKRTLPSPLLSSTTTESCQSLSTNEEEQNGYESTPTKETESVFQDKEVENGKKSERTKAPKVASLENTDLTVKQNFRRGKVVNLRAEENRARKLKFRQGKGLGDNFQKGNNEVEKKSFRKVNEVAVNENENEAESESEKVVLRHQDNEGKKEEQVLINNVIEATASKLVETRKSKVKALVGAFETVISLHETKSSSATTE